MSNNSCARQSAMYSMKLVMMKSTECRTDPLSGMVQQTSLFGNPI